MSLEVIIISMGKKHDRDYYVQMKLKGDLAEKMLTAAVKEEMEKDNSIFKVTFKVAFSVITGENFIDACYNLKCLSKNLFPI